MHEEARSVVAARSLRLIIFGGEALDFGSLKPWFDRHGDRRPQLVNMYGITETTVHVTYRALRAEDLQVSGGRIGRPITDLQLYILDPQLQPVSIGVPGEIYVAGEGLARGYLNHPELTAARFIPNPFSDRPGERLYRTGDLARRMPDDDIEYLGRIDLQVKIRGFRIELGEIESALRSHPAVLEAAVVARDNWAGEKHLVAYLVTREEQSHAPSQFRRFLSEKLPEHMIPSLYLTIETMPLTSNGKLDRKALPAPEVLRKRAGGATSLPLTQVENALAAIWRDVLHLEQVGVQDNFFDLGGHSLMAVQVISSIRKALRVEVPLRFLFEAPTIADLAGFVQSSKTGTQSGLIAKDGEIEELLAEIELLSDENAESELRNLERGISRSQRV
jgi:acyl carrier protein